jgi:uncharacterized YccA/Bax inhibitor family protein
MTFTETWLTGWFVFIVCFTIDVLITGFNKKQNIPITIYILGLFVGFIIWPISLAWLLYRGWQRQ